jgi:hypothetical protein
MNKSLDRHWDSDKQRWVYPSDADNELLAIADFLEWLCDNGLVVAEEVLVGPVNMQRNIWSPISEAVGAELATRFIKERKQP